MVLLNRFFPAALLALALGACTHEHHLTPPNVAAARLSRSQTKRVMVVLASPAVRPTYEASTDGHTWVLHGVRGLYEHAFRAALTPSVAAIAFSDGTPPPGYDAYVYPELALEMGGSLPHHCRVSLTVSLVDGQGRPVARRESTIVEDFMAVGDGERACHLALTASFNSAVYPVVAGLDTIPSRTP